MSVLQAIAEKWATPSMLMIVVGGIIWGVQLNLLAVQQARISENQKDQIIEIRKAQHQVVISQAENAIIVNEMAKQIQENTRNILDHNKEAEKWKRKILLNEQQNRAPGE
jgi:hypothetical protein